MAYIDFAACSSAYHEVDLPTSLPLKRLPKESRPLLLSAKRYVILNTYQRKTYPSLQFRLHYFATHTDRVDGLGIVQGGVHMVLVRKDFALVL